MNRRWTWCCGALATILLVATTAPAVAASLAPGFDSLAGGEKMVLVPPDVELFSISAGGVVEPRGDWTVSAVAHVATAMRAKVGSAGLQVVEIGEDTTMAFKEAFALHAAVASAIALHHNGSSNLTLPTKGGRLDWSFGDAFGDLARQTGARYALFSWIRDSYASGERVATMVLMAMLGVGIGGGVQVGYASLVDLQTGQVLWFNKMFRAKGDLRDASSAASSIDELLKDLPLEARE